MVEIFGNFSFVFEVKYEEFLVKRSNGLFQTINVLRVVSQSETLFPRYKQFQFVCVFESRIAELLAVHVCTFTRETCVGTRLHILYCWQNCSEWSFVKFNIRVLWCIYCTIARNILSCKFLNKVYDLLIFAKQAYSGLLAFCKVFIILLYAEQPEESTYLKEE